MDTAAEFREDAPEPIALERERRLQRCRERFGERDVYRPPEKDPWTAGDAVELRWLWALADAGHVGAQRLRATAVSSAARMSQLATLVPEFVEALAGKLPGAAYALLVRECAREAPDPAVLSRWLMQMGGDGPGIDAAMREMIAIRGALARPDIELLRREAQLMVRGDFHSIQRGDSAAPRLDEVCAALVFECARPDDPHAARLRRRAAELGSPHARLELALGADPDSRFPLGDLPGTKWRELGAAIGEARALGQLDAQACAFFRGIVEPRGEVRVQWGTTYGAPLRGILLWQLAASRTQSGERAALARLRRRAAELGCIDAITTCIGQDLGELRAWLTAGDKLGKDVADALRELPGLSPRDLVQSEAILRKWLATGGLLRRTASALTMLAGAAVELGEHGGSPDRDRAVELYAAATFNQARNPKTGAWKQTFCWDVARRFDPADAALVRDVPALAVAWYERAAAIGGQLSLQRLLEAHASADLGLARDAGVVLKRLDEFFADRDHRLDYGETRRTAEALRRCASQDPANAAKWNEAADRISPKGE